ncbi:hypothetical protein C8R46DRAFT_1352162 [Mycena filopes]|nr:hypothetical protein C8R46DRAFT_1352162 [Mycena filopes]
MSSGSLIPPELLCYIFSLTLPTRLSTDAIPAINIGPRSGKTCARVLDSPWNLTQVCSYWRALAISLPTLWTSMLASTTLLPAERSLLDLQLARTANAPLDIIVRFAPSLSNVRHHSPFAIFMQTLIVNSARWRTLHFQFDTTWGPQVSFLPLRPESLPALERLSFAGRGLEYLTAPNFVDKLPLLVQTTPATPGVRAIQGISLPWTQLRVYKATYHSPVIHCMNLAAMSSLVECEIDFGVAPAPDTLRHDILTLPRLRRLVLSHPAFLSRIAAPILQSLHIRGGVKEILPFLLRSCPPPTLRELKLLQCTSPASDIIALLRHTPALGVLSLGMRSAPAELVAALTVSTTANTLCSQLGSLSWADFDDALEPDAFTVMIESRTWGSPPRAGLDSGGSLEHTLPVRPLYCLALHSGRRRMTTALVRLRALRGLDVSLFNAKKGKAATKAWREY